jgi:phage FluMu protein Com
MENEMTNPLIQAYRKPAMYVALPSGGKYYKSKPKLSVDGELAIYSMTARDELVSKTPDALFNGEATFSLIRSCAPDIGDPHEMPVNDLMVVLVAIRKASYGPAIDVDLKCPSCNELNQLSVSIDALLATVTENKSNDTTVVGEGFTIVCTPYNLRDRTKLQLQRIKQQKLIESLTDANLNDEERQSLFGSTFVEIADLTVSLIANSIVSVQPPGGETQTDYAMVLEWLQTITKKDYENIRETVEALSANNIDTTFDATCQFCENTWKTSIDIDLANFFEG